MTPMPHELLEELVLLSEALKIGLHPTGSRAISPDTCDEGSDWDYYLLGNADILQSLLNRGYMFQAGLYYPTKTQPLYKWVGDSVLNLIVCMDEHEFTVWSSATHTAMQARLETRDERIQCFADCRAELSE